MNKKAILRSGILGLILCLVFIAVLTIQPITADDETHNLTLDIGGSAPEVIYVAKVSPGGNVDPSANSTTTVTFEVHVRDNNTADDISTVWLDAYHAGETNRSDTSCTDEGDIDGVTGNFTCQFDMYYYDVADSWNVAVYANDSTPNEASNTTQSFTYNSLHDIAISVSTIQFGSITMGSEEKADNDPQTITNIGNADVSSVNVTAYDVKHATEADYLSAANFTIGEADDCATSGDYMVNATTTLVSDITVSRGSSSTDSMYYCIPAVPYGLASGNYWTIAVWTVTSVSS